MSTVPETLNPQSLPVELNPMVDEKTGVDLKMKIKAQIAKDGAVYVSHKKKTK